MLRLLLTKVKKRPKFYLKKAFFLVFLLWYFFFSIPNPLFQKPNSTIVLSRDGQLLGGLIANDEQWRFPLGDTVPNKIKQCILHFEDEYFFKHPGINPISLSRAIYQNIKEKRIVSGASTITMQTVRLAKNNPPRTIREKVIELIQATRVELRYSKNEILNLYLSNAPFGGNTVGIEAASWRYYGRLSENLSWGEAATLAVLPNAPALIYPGKNQDKLLKKRNRLLYKLHNNNVIDKITLDLALNEPLPNNPKRIPQKVPHLLQLAHKNKKGSRINSSIDIAVQNHVQQVVNNYHLRYTKSEIHNMAAIVIDVRSQTVLAYVGNTTEKEKLHGNEVDIIQAPRSSGSILKPFLYEAMLSEGQIMPRMLLPDIPFKEIKNYNETYDGAVPANEALARSLNIPATYLLSKFGVAKFHNLLKRKGFSKFTKSSKHYGLSLIIGGGEVTLYELANAYCGMANSLKAKNTQNHIRYDLDEVKKKRYLNTHKPYATFMTLQALKDVVRPFSETGWQNFEGKQVAWKTGTSHGFRDAWAVGLSPDIVVAVWVGNADGEGRPDMTGTKVAAPVMFSILDYFRPLSQFQKPKAALVTQRTCKQSGYISQENCINTKIELLPKFISDQEPCPYHVKLFMDSTRQLRVNSSCYPVQFINHKKQMILPPQMAYFYAKRHPEYEPLPNFASNCIEQSKVMTMVYPKLNITFYLPKGMDNKEQSAVFEAIHLNENATIYWHLDGKWIGTTKNEHKLNVKPSPGVHKLIITDNLGNEKEVKFNVK